MLSELIYKRNGCSMDWCHQYGMWNLEERVHWLSTQNLIINRIWSWSQIGNWSLFVPLSYSHDYIQKIVFHGALLFHAGLLLIVIYTCLQEAVIVIISLTQWSWREIYWFHLVCSSVCLYICGQNRARSVSSAILVRSISYLHIL